MIRSSIRSLVGLFLEDPNLTQFTVGQLNDAIDRAQEQFAYDSRALFKDASTITVVNGTATYNLPSDFWLEKVVTHKGLKLTPRSRATLLNESGDDWTDDAGTPRHFIIDPEEARKQIRLVPIPQAGDAGANLILTYYPVPAAISSDSASPLNSSALMVQFHQGIAAYAAWLCLFYKKMTPEIQVKQSGLYAMYQGHVTSAIDRFGNTASEPIVTAPKRVWRKRR